MITAAQAKSLDYSQLEKLYEYGNELCSLITDAVQFKRNKVFYKTSYKNSKAFEIMMESYGYIISRYSSSGYSVTYTIKW